MVIVLGPGELAPGTVGGSPCWLWRRAGRHTRPISLEASGCARWPPLSRKDQVTRRSDLRADLDELAYELRRQGLTYQAIGERLGVSDDMARRVVRYERMLREQTRAASQPRSSSE